jgi:hypothetical protein
VRSGLLVKLLAVGVPLVVVVGIGALLALLFLAVGLRTWLRMRRFAAATAVPPVDLWAHGAYGLWTGMEDSATWTRERARDSLASWYGARDGAALGAVLDGLGAGQTGNAAWDQVRAVDLVRIGIAAGYLDGEAARKRVRGIATALRKAYPSWEALGSAFEQGMREWQDSRGITDPAETGRVQRNLPPLREVVWPRIAWSAKL